jgi:hypothetical protein
VYVIWLDEARQRAALELAHMTYQVAAVRAGAKRHDLPDWEDPADLFDAPPPPSRARDPQERAGQIAAFLAAAGEAADITAVPP